MPLDVLLSGPCKEELYKMIWFAQISPQERNDTKDAANGKKNNILFVRFIDSCFKKKAQNKNSYFAKALRFLIFNI